MGRTTPLDHGSIVGTDHRVERASRRTAGHLLAGHASTLLRRSPERRLYRPLLSVGDAVNRTDWKAKTLVALTLIFAVWPRMETFFWSTAAAGYLQPILLCLFLVRMYATSESVWALHRSRSQWMWLSAASFLAGLSFENIPLAIAPFLIGSLCIEGRRAISHRTVSPIVALLAGWLTLVLAASTGQRQAYYAGVLGHHELTLGVLLSRLPHTVDVFFSSARVLTVLALVCLVLIWRHSRERRRLAMLAGLVLLVALSVVAAPYIEPRAFILAWAVMFSLCVTAITQAALRFRRGVALYAVAALLMLGFPLMALGYYQQLRMDSGIPDARIRQARSTPECTAGVPVTLTDRWYPRRLVSPRNDWYRANPEQAGAYYGCEILIRQQ